MKTASPTTIKRTELLFKICKLICISVKFEVGAIYDLCCQQTIVLQNEISNWYFSFAANVGGFELVWTAVCWLKLRTKAPNNHICLAEISFVRQLFVN